MLTEPARESAGVAGVGTFVSSMREINVWGLYTIFANLLMMLFPFRRLMPLFYPGRLWLYLRLRLLERKVTRLTTIKPQTKPLQPTAAAKPLQPNRCSQTAAAE